MVGVVRLRDLADAHGAGVGASKPHRYYEIYEELLEPIRNEPLRLLELGVESGRSVSTWCDYLPNSTIVGLDFHDRPSDYPARAHYIQGRQEDPAALARACEIGSPFDVIIDDAAHVGKLAKASFGCLFEPHLLPGGFYVLEDFGTALTRPNWADAHPYDDPVDEENRLPSFEYGMIGLLKQIIDQLVLGRTPIRVDVRPGVAVVHKRGHRHRPSSA
jgi:hypothetical protein